MARRVKHNWEKRPGDGSRTKYPYDKWFDGDTWLLKRGTDFDIKIDSMLYMLRDRAINQGLEFRYEIDRKAETLKINVWRNDD